MRSLILRITLFSIVLTSLSFRYYQKKITIFSIGDSTMSNYHTDDNYPLRGWMMMIAPMFNDNVTVTNAAVSGISSKSYRTEGFWQRLIGRVKPGDYVFIQFGHNDEKDDTARHTDPHTTFRSNLLNYVNEVKAKGANPILLTPIVRRKFNDDGTLQDTHGEYVTAVRELAEEINVPLIDLNKRTAALVESMGPEASKSLYLYTEPKQFKEAPAGEKDDTHLCENGATKFAALAIEEVKRMKLPLRKYIR